MEILQIETIDQYNKLFDIETRHPLVSVVRLDREEQLKPFHMNVGFYALFLKETNCGRLRYGRTYYDYQEGTVVCYGPGQIVGIDNIEGVTPPKARGLLFHPDLIHRTSLGQHINDYTFFSYKSNEALHLSLQEREIFNDCLDKIDRELQHAVDKHTKRLITTNIELLLDYCTRFYDRQFITREEANNDVLTRFEGLLDEYIRHGTAAREGVPTVRYFAEKTFLSANYFGDLVKKETGKSAQEYIQEKMIDMAKEWLHDPSRTTSQIGYDLGFQYPQHFLRFFKRLTGITPREYRQLN